MHKSGNFGGLLDRDADATMEMSFDEDRELVNSFNSALTKRKYSI